MVFKLQEDELMFNPFLALVLVSYPLKTPENLFSGRIKLEHWPEMA